MGDVCGFSRSLGVGIPPQTQPIRAAPKATKKAFPLLINLSRIPSALARYVPLLIQERTTLKEHLMSLTNKVLIVEDEQVLAQNVKTYLDRRFADVRIAADGVHAMEMFISFEPDVVVLDYGLPGENGLQIYRDMQRLRAHPMACVLVTGYPLERFADPAKDLGVHLLVNKPFSLSELCRLIDQSAEEVSRQAH
jgi:CheY-like chemotaxis protein